MKTVLVAGGSGFIGSHLCDYLIEKNEKVICIDDLKTGNKKNIEHLFENKNFVFIVHDITKPFKINEKISQIYNMASPASPVDFTKIPIEILLAGSLGTKNLLDFALQNNASFLQASTSEVYGNPLEHPQKETYFGNVNPVGERSCYDEAKRFGEALTVAYKNKYKLDTKIIRIFNTYGPRMRANDGRVIPNMITQALQNNPISIYGDGKQTRSFCYVSDLVEGIYKMMNSPHSGPTNLGNPAEITILELATQIKKLSNSNLGLVHKQLPTDDPVRRKPDITKAKRELNWEPRVSLEKGLNETIEYFIKEL